jgi:hypothetical protein
MDKYPNSLTSSLKSTRLRCVQQWLSESHRELGSHYPQTKWMDNTPCFACLFPSFFPVHCRGIQGSLPEKSLACAYLSWPLLLEESKQDVETKVFVSAIFYFFLTYTLICKPIVSMHGTCFSYQQDKFCFEILWVSYTQKNRK